ncbi:VOC family protein [Streptomyces sp. TRM 70351]|uniref:VOC family protein n=1 Tax=Streptomyces sp. TRM 70351 TaxID=3116552 RepID=UPI002E7ABC0F|nr:VOC family protein [Streptomyces sp. TRM 70351]MEE1930889.1 VOC family protein [Streptomyces sp. TRM 70351]
MAVATVQVTVVDCPEPKALADFYAELLGGEVKGADDARWIDLYLPDGSRLAFQRAPGFQPPQWPAADRDSQQIHLDLLVDDMAEAEAKTLALGAKALDTDDDGGKRGFRVYADPAGHPFCLIHP